MAGAAPRKKAGRKVTAKGSEAPPRSKPTPRTTGTPDKPPKPRKVTAPAKPRKQASPSKRTPSATPTRSTKSAKSQARSATPPGDAAPPPGWLPAEPALEWIPVPEPEVRAPRTTPGQTSKPFHPATGAWIPGPPVTSGAPALPATPLPPVPSTATAPAPDPAAYRGGVGAILMHIVLGLCIALFAVGLGEGIVTGYALIFEPDSARAQEAFDQAAGTTARYIAIISVLNLMLFGAVPLAWVAATRVRAHPGTWRYLNLRFKGRDWLRGLALVPVMLVAVVILSSLYTLATKGTDGFTDTGEENPAVQAMLNNLSWPLALLIAFSAGVGEEIFFRGLLQRRIGIWAQAILFGLAHAAGGYIPQILFATGLGVAFGFLYKRGWSLTSLIVAHLLYDLVLLALALVFPELG